MKILITGANGLLGQKLILQLGSHGNVTVLGTGPGAARVTLPANASWQTLDVRKAQEVDTLLAAERPDVVIHTAAMTNVDQCETDHAGCLALNVEAVRNLAKACAAQGSYLLHLSTDFIFDGTAGPYTEEGTPNPISFYGESKLTAEQIVLGQVGLRWGIARTILVYGIAQDMSRSNIILWVKSSLEAGKKIQVVDDQWRTPTLAEDLADGCIRMALQQAEGIYNIGGPDLLTPYEMAMATATYFNLDKTLIEQVDGTRFSQPAKRPPRTGLVIDKARQNLGYAPHSFAEGIEVLAGQLV
jgi:dTDP-4-dehydrorhamnose reductase